MTVTTVTQDEAVNANGDSTTGPDAARSSVSDEVLLRVERSGTGTVRVGVPTNEGTAGQPAESPPRSTRSS